jgi:hypothetical protein
MTTSQMATSRASSSRSTSSPSPRGPLLQSAPRAGHRSEREVYLCRDV